MKIGITGHRFERLKGKQKEVIKWLNDVLAVLVAQHQKERIQLLCGMATGVDQMAALAALDKGAGVCCYFPYRKKLNPVQDYIAEYADEIRFQCDEYQDKCYFKRDRRIVDDCDLMLVVWDGKKLGGTYYTYKYAVDRGKPIVLFDWGQG